MAPHVTRDGNLSARLDRAKAALLARGFGHPRVALVLGSGLGAFADTLSERVPVAYADIDGMPSSAVAGHAGNLVFGRIGELPVVAMQGRVHLYEGHSAADVVFGLRLMITLGARTVVLTNAAGGIAPALEPGSLMLIEDQLNLTGTSCLLGDNDDAVGPRFPPMNDVYAPSLCALAMRVADEHGIDLHTGVYAGLLGPAYESAAEIRMLATLGASAVGMSTVQEAIAAAHMGARCLGISCITNRAAGLPGAVLDHDEVQRVAAASRDRFTALLRGVLQALGEVGDGDGEREEGDA